MAKHAKMDAEASATARLPQGRYKMLKFSVLGPPGLHFGGAWGPLGRLLGSPGRLLAISWACLGPLGNLLGALGHLLGVSWLSWTPPGLDFISFLGGVGQGFGLLWE